MKTSVLVIFQISDLIMIKFGMLLGLGLINLILYVSCWSGVQKTDNLTLVVSLKNNIHLRLHIYEPVSFKLYMTIGISKPAVCIPVLMILLFLQDHRDMRKQIFSVHFLANLTSELLV